MVQALPSGHPVLESAWARLEELGRISDDATCLTRTFLSPASRRAGETVMGWMRGAGMGVCHDALGNIRGRHAPAGFSGRPLLVGSHLDTVINAGKYDGALGIVVALAAIEWLAASGTPLLSAVDVLGFADEEGVRFQATYLGSGACLGSPDTPLLALRDESGKSMAEVIADEGWHEGAETIRYSPGEAAGYFEVHIEQGRVLENAGLSLGLVPSICGQTRARVRLTGQAEHAGTTPMDLRRDALAGAAACVLRIEGYARARPPLVATVGKLRVSPGAGNAVPGEVVFTLDIRHPQDEARNGAAAALQSACAAIAAERGLLHEWETVQQSPAVECDAVMLETLRQALAGWPPPLIPSGAGHDAVVFSKVMPVAMLFVRCRAGLSHHPDESITKEDLAAAIQATAAFMINFQHKEGGGHG
jgi:allantoate deiminase